MNGHIKKILFFALFILLCFLFPNSTVNATGLPQSMAYKYQVLGINAYNPCSSSTASNNNASCTPPTGDQITWIGDSYSVGAKDIIESTFPGVDLGPIDSHPYIHCSKHIGMGDSDTNPETCSSAGLSGVDLAKKIKEAGKMRPYLVFALATNDPDSDPSSYLTELMNTVGDSTQIILVTARTEDGSNYDKTNDAIRKIAESNTNVTVADWANSSEYKADFFAGGDGAHPFSNGGMETWVNIIKSALPQSCSGVGLLSGDTVEERVWNYLVSANIPNVSNRPEVIAGILGNINAESGFNPFARGAPYEGHYYYGLFQDYGGNNDEALYKEINAAVGGDYWTDGDTTDAPQDAIDKAIKITLDHLVTDDEEFKDFIKKIDRPTKKSGTEGAESYAELFLVTYERAVGGSSSINDPGVCQVVQEMYSGAYTCNYQGTNVRRQFAKEYYEKFASSTTSTGSSSVSTSSSLTPTPSTGSDCNKLAELRQELWNSASEKDRSDFMKTVCEENCSIAGVEGYMNQVIAYGSKHGTSVNGGDGTLAKWLDVQCEAFRPASASCRGEHTISSEEQSWIDDALNGSNHINFAIGNATGGSDVGAGKIVCVWNGEKCRDDVNYDQPSGTPCSAFTSSSSDECWGTEMAEGWNEKLGITNCGSSGGSNTTTTNTNSACAINSSSSCTETTSEDAFPNYYQGDPQWSGVELSGGCTLGPCGCGATSYAEIVTALSGQKVTPVDVAYMTDSQPYWTVRGQEMVKLDKMVGEKYGLEVEGVDYGNMSDFTTKAKKYLNEGWMIHLSGNVGDWGGLSSGAGHYVSLLKADGDKVLITSFNNIHGTSYYGKNSWITFEELEHLGVYTESAFSITRKKGSSGSNCDIGANGLTEEQAALFVSRVGQNYKNLTKETLDRSNGGSSDWNTIPSVAGCNREDQCSFLSYFFISNFTTIGEKYSYTGSGSVHGQLASLGATQVSGPEVFSVFDSAGSGHTGVVVGKKDDGSPIFIHFNGLRCFQNGGIANDIPYIYSGKVNVSDYTSGNIYPGVVADNDWGYGDYYYKVEIDKQKLSAYLGGS